MPSNGFCNGQRNDFKPTSVQTQVKRNDFKPTSCFSLDRWRPRFDGVMKCERKRREGSEKGENFGWNILREVRNGFWVSNGNIK